MTLTKLNSRSPRRSIGVRTNQKLHTRVWPEMVKAIRQLPNPCICQKWTSVPRPTSLLVQKHTTCSTHTEPLFLSNSNSSSTRSTSFNQECTTELVFNNCITKRIQLKIKSSHRIHAILTSHQKGQIQNWQFITKTFHFKLGNLQINTTSAKREVTQMHKS